jgi:hypothetical protein
VRSHTFQYRIVIMLILASMSLAGCGLLDIGTETPTNPVETEEPPTQAPPIEEPTLTNTEPPEPTATEETPTETAIAWYGRIASLPLASQFDDLVSIYPEGTAQIGIEGTLDQLEQQIIDLRDAPEPGNNAHFWGILICPALDYGGCQIRVESMRLDAAGRIFEPNEIDGWIGTIHGGWTEPGSGGDDYFQLDGDFAIQYGVEASSDPSGAIAYQIAGLRDTDTRVRVWGWLVAGLPDWNATQLQVNRLEIIP